MYVRACVRVSARSEWLAMPCSYSASMSVRRTLKKKSKKTTTVYASFTSESLCRRPPQLQAKREQKGKSRGTEPVKQSRQRLRVSLATPAEQSLSLEKSRLLFEILLLLFTYFLCFRYLLCCFMYYFMRYWLFFFISIYSVKSCVLIFFVIIIFREWD